MIEDTVQAVTKQIRDKISKADVDDSRRKFAISEQSWQKIKAQQVGVGHGEVQDKVQRTECENTRLRKSIFGMLECSESNCHFPCPQIRLLTILAQGSGICQWGKQLPALCAPQNLGVNT